MLHAGEQLEKIVRPVWIIDVLRERVIIGGKTGIAPSFLRLLRGRRGRLLLLHTPKDHLIAVAAIV